MAVRGALAIVVLAVASLQAQVTFERLLHTDREPHNWLTYSGNVLGQRYSPLNQITTGNVKNLELQWVWQAKSLEKYETTALVLDGILYTIQAPSNTNNADGNTQIVALDAVTGRQFWTFRYDLASTARTCCGRVNRGLAILGDTLYMGTLSSHLIAINAKIGTLLWDTTVSTPPVIRSRRAADRQGQGHHRDRRRRRRDPRLRGGVRYEDRQGDLAHLHDSRSGRARQRFVAGESWKTGGAGVWNSGSYDPETNLTFWGTGNPIRPEREHPSGRQPLFGLGDRAGCRHRQAEVALPVHAARRHGLRLHAGAGARGRGVQGAHAQGHAVGEPQRPDVHARSDHRRVPAGQAVREGQLDGRLR